MSDISLSKAVRSNLLSLQGTADMMATAQNRLSTGNKVNSALDNPSNWFTAKGLTNRSSDLNALMDSMANGIQTLKAADNGLSAMTKTLESMQSTLRQARQDKSFQTTSMSIDATAIGTSAPKTLDFSGGAFTSSTSTSLTNTLKTGNNGFVGTGSTLGINGVVTLQAASLDSGSALTVNLVDSDTATTAASKINTALNAATGDNGGLAASVVNGQLRVESTKGETVTVGGAAATHAGLAAGGPSTVAAASITGAGTVDMQAANLSAYNGGTITLTQGSNTTSYTFTNATTGQSAAMTSALAAQGFTVAATANGIDVSRADGANFKVEASDTTLGAAIGIGSVTSAKSTNGAIVSGTVTTITDSYAAKTVDQLVSSINADTNLTGKVRASNDNGKLRIENQSTQALTMTGVSSGAIDGSSSTNEIAGNSVRAGLASQFNELRDQLDKLADDASFNGINLMRGDKLTITFNETGTSSIDIRTKNGDTINASNLGVPTQLEEEQLDSDTNIDSLLTDMKTALDSVRSQASTFGSNLSIVQNRQDFTKAMIDTLETGAGNLTLADMNEEAANLLALQTRQQLSSNSLSLASQADQSILQLLR
ncbi:MAG: flagellin [Devosia sp.]